MRKNKDDILPNIILDEDDGKTAPETEEPTSTPLDSENTTDNVTEEVVEEVTSPVEKATPVEEDPIPVATEVSKPVESAELFEEVKPSSKKDTFTQDELSPQVTVTSEQTQAQAKKSDNENGDTMALPLAPVNKTMLSRINYERFVKIVSNIAFFFAALAPLMQLSTFIVPVVWFAALAIVFVIALCITIFTLGIIFLLAPHFAYGIWALVKEIATSFSSIAYLSAQTFNATDTVSLIGIALSVIALIFNFTLKRKKSALRISFLFVSIFVLAICFAVVKLTGGMQW